MRNFKRASQVGPGAALVVTMCVIAMLVPACATSTGTTLPTSSGGAVPGGALPDGGLPGNVLPGGAVRGDVDGLVAVGDGRSIYAKCQGQGSPTVVLIAGKGNGAQDWQDVLAAGDPAHDAPGDDLPWGIGEIRPSDTAVFGSVARFTRVCAYDRPDIRFEGTDVSTPRPQPHTVDLDVGDLHALLTALGEPAPYVLVAHSYGGLIASLFARTYPESVGALVMIDTVTPLITDVTTADRLVNWDAANSQTSPQVREGVQLIDAFEKIEAAPPLPDLPAVVMSADKPWRTDLLPAAATRRETVTFTQWLASLDLLAQDLGAEHITATGSGHDIYLYNPTLVTDAIRDVVGDVRGQELAPAS